MKFAYVLKGLPASGKSTVAEVLSKVLEYPIVSQDIFRQAKISEHKIRRLEDMALTMELKSNDGVIIDDTNLNPERMDQIKNVLSDANAKLIEVPLNVPPEKCVERDTQRTKRMRVGPVVIWAMYHKYINKNRRNKS